MYTRPFRYPQRKKSHDDKSGDLGDHGTSPKVGFKRKIGNCFQEDGRHLNDVIDMYMSYRWGESFNTVNRQIRDVITTGIDMCGRRMRKGGGDGPYIRRAAD